MNRTRIAIMLAAGVLLPAIGVAPQLQARLFGEEYAVRVAPVDPIDPFRGAYVDLNYPDLARPDPKEFEDGPTADMGLMPPEDERGDVYITLREEGAVWVADEWLRERPDDGPYLTCSDRDWRIHCGIESWFLPQREARDLERAVAGGDAVATIKIDSRGHAALTDIR